ncbi:MAG TPA: GIY-YIG nuclease family protein [Candidatus Peregrinibacteria bacterium]|nr:GIY-YIG nuclease family protein [Candidatus Peregrinibacteria bacterium]
MKFFYVYVIRSGCDKFYIGSTDNLQKRLNQHNQGLSKWTSRYKNWKLVYCEQFKTRTKALRREKFIKQQKGGDGFFSIINTKYLPGS